MSTSGSTALRSYTAIQLVERALRQAGVKAPQFTSEMLEIAMDVFNAMLDEFLNLGIQLWSRDRVILPLYLNRNQVVTPQGTSVIIDLQQRTLMRPAPSMALSDQGGDASLAFDGNLATACLQTAVNGSITAFYSNGTVITQVGVLFADMGSMAYFVEYSLDGVTDWTAMEAVSVDVVAGQWMWIELDGAPAALGWRIRSVGTLPLRVSELYFGNNPSDIPLPPFTYDDWDSLPNKLSPGQPLQWYQDRQLDVPVLYVWPVPDPTATFMTLVARRRRYLDQVTDWQQALDLSRRWYEYATCSMARRLCKELPEADVKRFDMLQSEEARTGALAAGEERDPAPSRYNPGLDVYQF